MNEQDFELLSQYLDGELDPFTARALEQRLGKEPALQATLDQLRKQNERLQAAFSGTDRAPRKVQGLLESESNVVAFPQRASRPVWQYAVAASLVAAAGLLLTPDWHQVSSGDPMLANVLENTPSMASGWEALDDGRQVRPVLSFKDTDGNWCREYLISGSAEDGRGIACRDGQDWSTEILAAADIPGDAGEFRPAGAGDTDEIATYQAEKADGIALSAAEEAELIANQWK